MKICFLLFVCSIFMASCTYKVYVVRHAEKAAAPADNPLLSDAGTERAISLRETLKGKKIKKIYSTNTTRTKSTAAPLAQILSIETVIYPARPDSNFINTLKTNASNQLVVGHSNTIDDIVNMLCGSKVVSSDLPDAVYDNLYVIKLPRNKTGNGRFTNLKYGKPAPAVITQAAPAMMQN